MSDLFPRLVGFLKFLEGSRSAASASLLRFPRRSDNSIGLRKLASDAPYLFDAPSDTRQDSAVRDPRLPPFHEHEPLNANTLCLYDVSLFRIRAGLQLLARLCESL